MIQRLVLYDPGKPMLFTSTIFVAMFVIFYALYSLLSAKIKWRNILLLFFSFFFYYKLSGMYVILLFCMACSDYMLGLAISGTVSAIKKKYFLLISIIINIGCLVSFKYLKFIFGLFAMNENPLVSGFVANILFPA